MAWLYFLEQGDEVWQAYGGHLALDMLILFDLSASWKYYTLCGWQADFYREETVLEEHAIRVMGL